MWDAIIANLGIPFRLGPMTPITHIPQFLSGVAPDLFLHTVLKHSYRSSSQSSTCTWFQAQQLTAFVRSLVAKTNGDIDLISFDRLFLSDDKTGRSASELYVLLRDVVRDTKPLFEQEWERALGGEISEQDWWAAYHCTGITYLSSRLQERNTK